MDSESESFILWRKRFFFVSLIQSDTETKRFWEIYFQHVRLTGSVSKDPSWEKDTLIPTAQSWEALGVTVTRAAIPTRPFQALWPVNTPPPSGLQNEDRCGCPVVHTSSGWIWWAWCYGWHLWWGGSFQMLLVPSQALLLMPWKVRQVTEGWNARITDLKEAGVPALRGQQCAD